MRCCKSCGRDISGLVRPGPGRPRKYCESRTCIRLRAAKRKRDERHQRIQRDPKRLGRVPWGHYYLPGPVLRETEDVGRIDWDCFLIDWEQPVSLASEQAALPDRDRKRVEKLDALADQWLERGGPA
jgi:hypothetical protein